MDIVIWLFKTRYYISLYVIIPLIYAGLSVLSSTVMLRTFEYSLKNHLHPKSLVVWATVISGGVSFLCGLLIVWIILRPMKKFIEHARQFEVLPKGKPAEIKTVNSGDELSEYVQVFDQVTTALSMVDARQLFPNIIAESHAMRGVLSQILKVAPTDATVLVFGESGTGKELVATSLFAHSLRKDRPFIKLNCVAIAEGLWESELFGHEKGAFTGATARKPGKFELANGGTLFLDEIGDIPLHTQAKLLRVLQEREFERVGGTQPIQVDVRFISATNKNLEQMVQKGAFREDLYYRLNVFSIRIPSLRERKEDIAAMAGYFARTAPKTASVSSEALNYMTANYSWPGNVRELKNVIERASLVSESGVIEPEHLPVYISKGLPQTLGDAQELQRALSIDEQLEEIEKAMIMEALRKTSGVQARAADMLGIKERSLWHRTKKYNIDVKIFKEAEA